MNSTRRRPDLRLARPVRRALSAGALGLALGLGAPFAAVPLTAVAPGALVPAAQAQDIQRIAAVVNEDAVSLHDIITRMDLVIATSNLPDGQETRQRLLPQVLEGLIVEAIKLQEAERLGISVSSSETAEGIRQVERQNNLPPGGLLEVLDNQGVPRATFERQVSSEIAWLKVVRSSLAGRVGVTDAEIDARMDALKEVQGKPEALLAQIFLPIDDPSQEDAVRAAAERLAAQITSGASFPALAQQFSRDPSAARGGDMGWVPLPTLEPELREVVAASDVNRITLPVRTPAGYTILLVREKRIAGSQGQTPAGFEMAQIMLPDTGAQAMDAERRAALTREAGAAEGCAAFITLAEQVGTPGSGMVGRVTLNDLPPAVAAVVRDLPEGAPSRAIAVPGGEVVAMVCQRSSGGGGANGLPPREDVMQQIEQEKIEALAQRRLRDLRRAAIVDVRL